MTNVGGSMNVAILGAALIENQQLRSKEAKQQRDTAKQLGRSAIGVEQIHEGMRQADEKMERIHSYVGGALIVVELALKFLGVGAKVKAGKQSGVKPTKAELKADRMAERQRYATPMDRARALKAEARKEAAVAREAAKNGPREKVTTKKDALDLSMTTAKGLHEGVQGPMEIRGAVNARNKERSKETSNKAFELSDEFAEAAREEKELTRKLIKALQAKYEGDDD